ncbi:uncharacterized protein LOC133505609 [Syngnathoides biaculeatus]|uniref:uncharacterized protein LOC133505609 n=1 Tax=Syngnathoides biaculeatus TaxID=300417 RepID=UPI002ADDF24E|nr:uncharacterized protein LOC133505609 [Syngnathoides biaculeatus]
MQHSITPDGDGNMHHYHLLGYEVKLLGELQKQQNNFQFCDTILQTDGISVPTHSFVLAALSPYLSQRLSDTPSPPSGQKLQLQLEPLKAHTLLKLVGLFYSGELVVQGSLEQSDLMDAIQTFGITPLVERPRNAVRTDEQPQRNHVGSFSECSRIIKDTLHIETAGRKVTDRSIERRSYVSMGTQTPSEHQGKLLTTKHIRWPTQNIPLEVCVTRSHQPSASITNAMSNGEECSHWTGTYNTDPSFYQRSQHQCSDSVSSCHLLTQTKDNSKTSRAQVKKPEDKNANSAQNRPAIANLAEKNLAKTKLMESTEFSVKVKLRRRKKEKVWEVVSTEDEVETMSVFASMSQESHPTATQTSHNHIADVEPSNSTQPQTHRNSISEPSDQFIDHTVQHQNGMLQLAPAPEPQCLAEESDEQIEKMLEDFMIGLNILPALEAEEDNRDQTQNRLNVKVQSGSVIIPQQPLLQDLSSASSMGQMNQVTQHDRTDPPFQEREALSSFFPTCLNDMQLPRCLSPIEPFTSVGIHDATTNDHQLSLCARPLLTEQSSLVSPLADGEDKGSLLSKRHPSKLPKQCLKQVECEPQQSRNCLLPCIKNKVDVCPTAAQRDAYPLRRKRTLVSKKGLTIDGNIASKRRKVCIDYPQDYTSSVCDELRNIKTTSICLVRLSQNNVLAKERKMATRSLKSPPICLRKHDQQSTTNKHLKKTTRSAGRPKSVNTHQSHMKTVGVLKTVQVGPSDTCSQSVTETNSEVHRPTVAANKKKKRGRPPKAAPPVISKSKIQEKMEEEFKINVEKSDKLKGKAPRIYYTRGKKQVVPLKSITNAAKSDDDAAPKRMVALAEFQTFVKTQHLNKKESGETEETHRNILNGDNHEGDPFIQVQGESLGNGNVSTDQNPNEVLKKSMDQNEKLQLGSWRSSGKGTTSSDVNLSEMHQTQKIKELESVVTSARNDRGCSPSDKQPRAQNQMSLEPNMNTQIGTCWSPLTGTLNSPEISQEELIEVDALLSSPEKMPVITQCEYALVHTETTQIGVNGEIDVTGDEMD